MYSQYRNNKFTKSVQRLQGCIQHNVNSLINRRRGILCLKPKIIHWTRISTKFTWKLFYTFDFSHFKIPKMSVPSTVNDSMYIIQRQLEFSKYYYSVTSPTGASFFLSWFSSFFIQITLANRRIGLSGNGECDLVTT